MSVENQLQHQIGDAFANFSADVSSIIQRVLREHRQAYLDNISSLFQGYVRKQLAGATVPSTDQLGEEATKFRTNYAENLFKGMAKAITEAIDSQSSRYLDSETKNWSKEIVTYHVKKNLSESDAQKVMERLFSHAQKQRNNRINAVLQNARPYLDTEMRDVHIEVKKIIDTAFAQI